MLRHKNRLGMLLAEAGMSRGSFSYQLAQAPRHAPGIAHRDDIAATSRSHEGSKGRYGYRRVTMDLRNKGIVPSHETVQMLMRHERLRGASPKAGNRYNSYRGEVGKVAPNLLNREFFPGRPMERFAAGVGQFAIGAGKLYLSTTIDVVTNEIVAYEVSRTASLQHMSRMLLKFGRAIRKNNAKGAMLHSDQGRQYKNIYYWEWVQSHNVVQSMSRKATTHDNIMIEIFFGRMKVEMFYGKEKTFKTLDEFETAIKDYIHWYNHRRVCKRLNGLSPVNYRKQAIGQNQEQGIG